ncbi:MAG: hypothetical protein KF866_06700 [Phycisphaeraceae bacterium]|nr:hypothetical protein [Phycisphaeraceae bacterium]MCW5755456.1 hypothetical protein [Phycisphaeraceae bacterium]
MDKRMKIVVAVVALALAGGVLAWHFSRSDRRPGPVGPGIVVQDGDTTSQTTSGPTRAPAQSEPMSNRAIGGN